MSDINEGYGSDALTQYMREIRRFRLLNAEAEAELARRADDEAINDLICCNLRFVVWVARRYANRGVALLDLIQEGNTGLIEAAKRFDPAKGRFVTYAVWWIRRAILLALADQGRPVSVPIDRANDIARVLHARARLRQNLHREPRTDEVAAAAQMKPNAVRLLTALHMANIHLDALSGEGNNAAIANVTTSEPKPADTTQDVEMLTDGALRMLPARDADILRLYFGLEGERQHTLAEIGTMLGVTRERVGQIRKRALKRVHVRIAAGRARDPLAK